MITQNSTHKRFFRDNDDTKMELPLSVSLKIEVRAVICYLTVLGLTRASIEQKIKEGYSEVISQQMINIWCTMFPDSCTDLDDNVRAGRPSITDEDAMNTVCWLLQQDLWVRVSEILK